MRRHHDSLYLDRKADMRIGYAMIKSNDELTLWRASQAQQNIALLDLSLAQCARGFALGMIARSQQAQDRYKDKGTGAQVVITSPPCCRDVRTRSHSSIT